MSSDASVLLLLLCELLVAFLSDGSLFLVLLIVKLPSPTLINELLSLFHKLVSRAHPSPVNVELVDHPD